MTAPAPAFRARTLHFALLTLLGSGPRTGYELTRRMDRPLGFYWRESQGQVYPALADLARAGWVTVAALPGRGPSGRKLYTLTVAGRRALGEWASAPAEARPTRDELVVKVSALWAADPDAARAMLAEEERRHRAQQRTYQEILDLMAEDGEASPDEPRFWSRQTVLRGLDYERGRARWCAELGRLLAERSRRG